jgi:hypothetical protein
MDAFLILLFIFAGIAVAFALAITIQGFILALMWMGKWMLRRNNKNNHDNNNAR